MKEKRSKNPFRKLLVILTAGIFLIMLTVMTLQGFLMYLTLRFRFHADIGMPQFWRPIPLLMVISAVVGVALTVIFSRVPLRPVQELIQAINQLADGNFHVRIHLDLTQEFVRLSDSFNRMAQELENTELLRSDFINNFSHEFKTPIVSLRGFARLLKSDSLSRQEREEYLNLSKIEKLNILSDMETFGLSEEIRQSILLLASKWQKKEIELIIDMDELDYHGSRDLLNQVWINLIDNAIKFSPEKGKIKIKLHRKHDMVVFQILDNGCGMEEGQGIAAQAIPHIFDRFYQGDPSHTTEGNGIGLTVVQKIVELHKGTIDVQSEAGIGTTFTVSLPEYRSEIS